MAISLRRMCIMRNRSRIVQHAACGGRNFWQNEWSDFITRSLHLLYYDLANYISVVDFLVQPFITALSALFECTSHAGEQFPIGVAIVVLAELFSSCTISGVEHLVLFSAGSGGRAYSIGGHFRCHSIAVLVFYNQYPIFKCYIGVGYLPLFQP